MVNILNDRFCLYNNFEIINKDVLKTDLNQVIADELNGELTNVKIVANLPYYITTPIIMKLLEDRLNIDNITVMVQKEVAERLAAEPGGKEAGSITYTVWYYTTPKIVLEVPKNSFIPEPEVTSSVIQFDVLKKPRIEVENEELFFRIIKTAFMQKRKTLMNTLINGKIIEKREGAERLFDDLNLDYKIRGERLTLIDFKNIADYLNNN